MNSQKKSLNFLVFCYAFFSFALYTPVEQMNIKDWTALLSISLIVYILFSLVIFNNRELKPLANLFVLIYTLMLFAKQIKLMWQYMKVFHGQTAGIATFIIAGLVIIALTVSDTKIYKLALPVSAMIFVLVSILILLNADKINPRNLYQQYTKTYISYEYKTLFDYIIPFSVISKSRISNIRKNGISVVIASTFLLLLISIFAFSCLKGDLLYSLSPLQMLFQITSTEIIKNFDAIYNYLLYFAFFSSLAVLADSYKTVKRSFKYFNNADLLLIILFLMLLNKFNNIYWFGIETAMVLVIFFGRGKVVANENK